MGGSIPPFLFLANMSSYICDESESCHFCGAIGALIDDLPRITHANVRPYIVAVLLHRGAVSFSEIVGSITPHCPIDDLRIDDDEFNKTSLERIVEEVLGEMVIEKILRYNEDKDIWVITPGDANQNVPRVINWAAATGAQIPPHFTLEMSKPNFKHGWK